MNQSVLFVDDEQNVLDGIRRQLRKQFSVETALGPDEGLARLRADTEYAVVVSDMRMPGMNGIEFLNHAQRISPNTVRMMLTGNADQQTASDAVNKGSIFRFLNKPCSPELLTESLSAGIRQYELINAEKELLEKTLTGSIEALVDILALSNPAAFSRAERIKYFVVKTADVLQIKNRWQLEVSAMLSHIGYVTIPTEIMEKTLAGEALEVPEQEMLAEHSKDACHVLDKIPRLEMVSSIIALKDAVRAEDTEDDLIVLGAQILRCASDYDEQLARGTSPAQAMQNMKNNHTSYNSRVLAALEGIEPPQLQKTIELIPIHELRLGMILAADIRSTNDVMIVSKGQSVSRLMRRRLENFLQQKTISEKVRVYTERIVF
ncbi:response regulator [Pontiellaceae bacterium B1224]|nr:response regulator [Pontiellaceae bacterium B1224]